MATHPTILGDLAANEMKSDDKTSLDVERDLAVNDGALGGKAAEDPARNHATPPSDTPAPDARRQGNDDEADGA